MRHRESELDRELFVSEGRTARLAGEGQLLLPHAWRILEVEAEALAVSSKVDLALAPRGRCESGGMVLHREPLIWVAADGHRGHTAAPLALAVRLEL